MSNYLYVLGVPFLTSSAFKGLLPHLCSFNLSVCATSYVENKQNEWMNEFVILFPLDDNLSLRNSCVCPRTPSSFIYFLLLILGNAYRAYKISTGLVCDGHATKVKPPPAYITANPRLLPTRGLTANHVACNPLGWRFHRCSDQPAINKCPHQSRKASVSVGYCPYAPW